MDIGEVNVRLLVVETTCLPRPVRLSGSSTLSLWGFTCNSSGVVTYSLKGKGPYVHAMNTVSRGIIAMDQLRTLLASETYNPMHWWPGGSVVISNRDTEGVHGMIKSADRMLDEYNKIPRKNPRIVDLLTRILEIRVVAATDAMLIVRAIQQNSKCKNDVHPFRNPMGLNSLQQQMNLMSPTFMAFFLKVIPLHAY